MTRLEVDDAHVARVSLTLASLVDAIGRRDFGSRLLNCLNNSCGAEYLTVLHLESESPRVIATEHLDGVKGFAAQQLAVFFKNKYWRRDPMLAQVHKTLDVDATGEVHTSMSELPAEFTDLLYRDAGICDRMVLYGRGRSSVMTVSMLRTTRGGSFSRTDLSMLGSIGALIIATIQKHLDISLRSRDVMLALTSLPTIEQNLTAKNCPLSRREAEVCARIIYGMSAIGIALDLGISEETVVTYRKRSYQRLNITTQRDLYVWYIGQWSESPLSSEPLN